MKGRCLNRLTNGPKKASDSNTFVIIAEYIRVVKKKNVIFLKNLKNIHFIQIDVNVNLCYNTHRIRFYQEIICTAENNATTDDSYIFNRQI